jgi:Spy/CpxP family protein refolding chaperone
MLEQLKAKLSLTDDQIKQVKQIVRAQREQGQAIRQDAALSDEDRRAKMQGLMKTARDQIRAILTPDQQTIFDSMPMGRRRRPPAADGAADAPPPMPEGAPLTPPPPPPSN